MFQTGWFLESMWTQVLILQLLRTKQLPLDTKQTGAYGHGSYDSGDCIIYTAAGYSGREDAWNDCDVSCLFSVLVADVIAYLLLVTLAKAFYIKKNQDLI